MELRAHWQAIYDEMRAALDAEGYDHIPIFHVTSVDTQTGQGAEAPFIIYRQDVERSKGTMGGGELAVLNSGWVITSYAFDLAEGLDYLAAIETGLADTDMSTDDGYSTTALEVIGVQTLYEDEYKTYATHLRCLWERSA